MAERVRFELTVRVTPDNGFRDRRIRPLCHLSLQQLYYFKYIQKKERCCVAAFFTASRPTSPLSVKQKNLQKGFIDRFIKMECLRRQDLIKPTNEYSGITHAKSRDIKNKFTIRTAPKVHR